MTLAGTGDAAQDANQARARGASLSALAESLERLSEERGRHASSERRPSRDAIRKRNSVAVVEEAPRRER